MVTRKEYRKLAGIAHNLTVASLSYNRISGTHKVTYRESSDFFKAAAKAQKVAAAAAFELGMSDERLKHVRIAKMLGLKAKEHLETSLVKIRG